MSSFFPGACRVFERIVSPRFSYINGCLKIAGGQTKLFEGLHKAMRGHLKAMYGFVDPFEGYVRLHTVDGKKKSTPNRAPKRN